LIHSLNNNKQYYAHLQVLLCIIFDECLVLIVYIVCVNKWELVVATIRDSDMNIQQWADALGMHRNQVSNWLNGKTKNIRESSLIEVGRVVGMKPVIRDGGVEFDELRETTKMPNIEQTQDKLIHYMENQIESLKQEVKSLKHSKHPETLGEISDMLHDASERWNWVFYKTDKPMSCTRKGIFRNVNPALCKLLGYTEDEMLGKSLLEFIHSDDHKRAVREMKKSTRNIQLRVCKSNGKYCKMNIEAQEFGTNGNTFSVGMITCCDEGCPDL